MSRSISNLEIENIFKDINNEDVNGNSLGVYPSNKITKFISFKQMMPGKKYPFLTAS